VHQCACVFGRVSDKATDTINELRRVLDREPVVVGVTDEPTELVEHADYSYGAAGHRLRSLLRNVTESPAAKTVLFAEPPHVLFSVSIVQ